jgi:hypothetical protein
VKIRHAVLIALFALLQGMAPLLHAHMGVDASGLSGVHMHGAPHGAADRGAIDRGAHSDAHDGVHEGVHDGARHAVDTHWSGAGPVDMPVVGLGQELRRDSAWQPLDIAAASVSGWNPSKGRDRARPPTSAAALPPCTACRRLPPAHAPPAGPY